MRVAALLVSGALYGCSFPPLAWKALAWVALVPLFVALEGVTTRRALAYGWLWGIAAAYAVGDYFPRAVARYWDQPLAVGFGLFFLVSTFTGALQYAAFATAYSRLTRRRRATTPLLVAAGWVAAELARARLFGGNPWALVGFSQAGVLPLIQIADVTGVYGVSFCLVAVNAALALWWKERDWRGLGAAFAAVAMVVGYGVVRLRTFDASTGEPTRIAIVQAALPVSGQWDPTHYGRNLDTYLRLTSRAIANEHPALVVWPESALTFFLEQEPAYRSSIARVLGDGGTELLTGGPRTALPADGYYNAAFVLAPDGTTRGVYDKRVLLPFGEYFPFGTGRLVRRGFGSVRTFLAGAPTLPLPTVAGRAGVLICNEAFYPEIAAERVRDGAEWLVVLANDSWAGEPRFAEIAAGMAAFRAVEVRRDVVRASTWGPSWVVDARGEMTVGMAEGVEAMGMGSVRRRSGGTAYGWLGDGFAVGCVVAAIVAVIAGAG